MRLVVKTFLLHFCLVGHVATALRAAFFLDDNVVKKESKGIKKSRSKDKVQQQKHFLNN